MPKHPRRTNRAQSAPSPSRAPQAHSDDVRARALAAFAKAGTVLEACRKAGIGRRTWYDWLDQDKAFAAEVARMTEDVIDELEKVAMRRAKDGSDYLLTFLLKARRRGVYGDRTTITLVHPDVVDRLRRQVTVIASRERWTSRELLDALSGVWDGEATTTAEPAS